MSLITKRRLASLASASALIATVAVAAAPSAAFAATGSCATIKGGQITDTAGNTIVAGTDKYGYNYGAHSFTGTYDSSDRTLDGLYWGDPASVDYADDSVSMKWSDEWLATVDCNNDGKLDRGLVNGVVNGTSQGWLTNHIAGDYTLLDGTQAVYTEFDKIVYVGPGQGTLWGDFKVVQQVINDPAAGLSGLQVKEPKPSIGK